MNHERFNNIESDNKLFCGSVNYIYDYLCGCNPSHRQGESIPPSRKIHGGHCQVFKFCPDCKKLEDTRKKCLKCQKEFTPTCKVSHHCKKCYSINKSKPNMYAFL